MTPADDSIPQGTAPQPAGDYETDNEGASQTVPPPEPRRPRRFQTVVLILVVLAVLALLAAFFHMHK